MGRDQQRKLPAGWTPDVKYTQHLNTENRQCVNPNLKQRVRAAVTQYRSKLKHPSSKNVRIKTIDNPHHPAYGQRGLFAARRLEPKEWVIDYAGELLPDSSRQAWESNYCLGYTEGHSIDAWKVGNEARMVNDFRGVPATCTADGSRKGNAKRKPNVEFTEYEKPSRPGELPILGYRVMHEPIKKGEELLTSYGKGFWAGRGLMGTDSNAATCPGRHVNGLQLFTVPEGSSYLCFLCSSAVDASISKGFCFCERCNYGVCRTCRQSK